MLRVYTVKIGVQAQHPTAPHSHMGSVRREDGTRVMSSGSGSDVPGVARKPPRTLVHRITTTAIYQNEVRRQEC